MPERARVGLMFLFSLLPLVHPGSGGEPRLDPASILALLIAGNNRFMTGTAVGVGDATALRVRLARDGQSPLAAIVGCSDSRVPVELIFDQPPGRLFVIRTVGNAAGEQTTGGVQYAVDKLGVPLVVVMGHSDCDAVLAVMDGEGETARAKTFLEPLAASRRSIGGCLANRENRIYATTIANVRRTRRELLLTVPELARASAQGAVSVRCALYDIKTGMVQFLEEK